MIVNPIPKPTASADIPDATTIGRAVLTAADAAAARNAIGAAAVSGAGNNLPVLTTQLSRIRDLPLRRMLWWGDSTVEVASGNNNIPANWGSYYAFQAIPGITLNKNFGGSGVSSAALLNTTPLVNVHGNNFTPEGVAAECAASNVDVLVYTFGLNDFRINANLTTYGSSAWKTAVQAMQTNAVEAIRRVRVTVPNIPVMWLVQNTVCQTGGFLFGIGGQAVTDAGRAAYLGDARYGVNSLADLVSNSQVCDAGGNVFGTKSWPLVEYPTHINYSAGADGLHPTTQGYLLRSIYVGEWLAAGAPEEFTTITSGIVTTSAATYMDLQFQARHAWMFGNSSGVAWGAVSEPAIGQGDWLRFVDSSGVVNTMRLVNKPYQNVAEYQIRFGAGQGPDGTFRTDIAAGSSVSLQRRTLGSVYEAAASRGGYVSYPFRVTAGGNGTATIRGIGWAANKLSARAPTTSDFLCHRATGGGIGGDGPMGIALTGATITATGVPGEYTIAKAGTYYGTAVGQTGAIIAYA